RAPPPASTLFPYTTLFRSELARAGKEVTLKSRTVTIHEFEITKIALPEIHFRIACSTGTYIRSLAHDFGAALGVGGYLSALRRIDRKSTRLNSSHVKISYA